MTDTAKLFRPSYPTTSTLQPIAAPDLFVTLDSDMPHSATNPSAAAVTLRGVNKAKRLRITSPPRTKYQDASNRRLASRTPNTPVYPYICAESYATAPALGHHRTCSVRRRVAGSWYTGRRTRLGRLQRDGRYIRIGQRRDQAGAQVIVLPAHHPHTGLFCIGDQRNHLVAGLFHRSK